MKWISVKDKLPTEYGEYIVYTNTHTTEILTYNGNTGVVTHWMPLPKPPTEEKNELESR